jgi:hypothetical protein
VFALRLVACVGALATVGCSFPDVTFNDVADGGGDAVDGTLTEEGTPLLDALTPDRVRAADGDAAMVSDRTSEDTVAGDALVDIVTIDDVINDYIFEAAPDAPACDQDQDGYLAMGTCGGNDCDDQDGRAHPGAGFVTDLPHPPTNGDWNCDGALEKEYLWTNLTCGGLNLGQCPSIYGFQHDPGCGQTDTFVTCTTGYVAGILGLTCTNGSTDTRKQGCR